MTVHEIALIAFDGCIGSSVHGPADLFRTANVIARRAGRGVSPFHTRIVSHGARRIRASNGHVIEPDGDTASAASAEVIMVPGIDVEAVEDLDARLTELRPIREWLRARAEGTTILTGSCTGTFLLADAGVLTARSATTTWWLEDAFRKRFPGVDLRADRILIDEGTAITSAAGTSYLDLAVHLIERLEGPDLARLCARFMVVDGGRTSQRPYSIPWHFMRRDELIERADAWIRSRLAEKTSVEALARHLGVSSRTLIRRFREHTGMTTQAFVQRTRIDQAKLLLETTRDPVAQIAPAVGYEDENAFRRAFVAATGHSPVQHRRRFRSGRAALTE